MLFLSVFFSLVQKRLLLRFVYFDGNQIIWYSAGKQVFQSTQFENDFSYE